MTRSSAFPILAALLLALLSGPAPAATGTFDLDDPAQRLEAYVRVNGDTSGKAVPQWASGIVYAHVPGEKPRALFGVEVLGMGRLSNKPTI